MPGTKTGAIKGVKTKKERYGKDYYKRIGKAGGLSLWQSLKARLKET